MQSKELLSIYERSTGNLFSENNKKEGLAKTGNNPVKPVITHLQEISSKRYTAFIVIKENQQNILENITLVYFLCWCQFDKFIIYLFNKTQTLRLP